MCRADRVITVTDQTASELTMNQMLRICSTRTPGRPIRGKSIDMMGILLFRMRVMPIDKHDRPSASMGERMLSTWFMAV